MFIVLITYSVMTEVHNYVVAQHLLLSTQSTQWRLPCTQRVSIEYENLTF